MQWREIIEAYFQTVQGKALWQKVQEEYQHYQIFPPKEQIFHAFELTPIDKVRVVILGQDPYHDVGQAQGLAFSIPAGMTLPPSLRNIFQELSSDLDVPMPKSGDLTDWAKQGVLLLNTTLTVRAHQANSHAKIGWQDFTDYIIQQLNNQKQAIVFVLWGKAAGQKKQMITASQHTIIQAAHPSPLSAYRGFFGSRPFSQINQRVSQPTIQWSKEEE